MSKVAANRRRLNRVAQGDIFRDVEYIEYAIEKKGIIEVGKIVFPLVIVLAQDCDLEQEARYEDDSSPVSSDDKRLISALVAPLYNAEHVYEGSHLSQVGFKMATINKKKTPGENLRKNETPRYHYLSFPSSARVVDQVIDFKHYFSVNIRYLRAIRKKNFACRISELFREDVSLRFSSYLSRIGLPALDERKGKPTQSAPSLTPPPGT